MCVWLGGVCLCLSLGSACVYMCVRLALGHEFPQLLGEAAGQVGAGLFLFVVWRGLRVPSLRNYPLRSPRKHLCVLFPWPSVKG